MECKLKWYEGHLRREEAAREAAAQIEVMLVSAGQQACIVRHTAASLHVWRATRFDQHAALMLFGAGCCMLVAGF